MGEGAYQGVILAAGHGSRMGPFGEYLPKPIVPICNRPLLAYQLDHMRALGIEEVFIVIGHLGHRIIETVGDGSEYGVRIKYVEQERRLGIAHAVGQLERYVDRPFLLILGDIFFEVPNLRRMVEEREVRGATAVLAVKEEQDAAAVKKNFSVTLREDGTVKRVIEKPRHVPNLLKGCGLYLFDLPIFDAIRRTPRTALRDEYELTDSIQILIDIEYPVRTAPIVEWDMNITFIGDLIACCRHELAKAGKRSITGKECAIAEGVVHEETVLGDRVSIPQAMTLQRCVVLPDTVVNAAPHYRDAVITPDGVLEAET